MTFNLKTKWPTGPCNQKINSMEDIGQLMKLPGTGELGSEKCVNKGRA